MRGADASAGTIKSGGATRRAAKMVVLDVDHPDIDEFIETKAREEEKIRVLRDAGFDMDLGGKDITSASSTRTPTTRSGSPTSSCARSSEDAQFGLRARHDRRDHRDGRRQGPVPQDRPGRLGVRRPGIQYDDTINDWHTCPESGRITASNPCCEYVHLDNSSCNLASINLLKFLRDDDTFDVGAVPARSPS